MPDGGHGVWCDVSDVRDAVCGGRGEVDASVVFVFVAVACSVEPDARGARVVRGPNEADALNGLDMLMGMGLRDMLWWPKMRSSW